MFFILTLVSLILTSLTYGETACDKYWTSMEIYGHCFFEPPDDRYENQYHERLKNGMIGFILARARDLCRKHSNSTILHYDMRDSNNDSIAKAIRHFMETRMRMKYNHPVDCYTELKEKNPNDLDCFRQSAQLDKWKNQSMLFITDLSYRGVFNKESDGWLGDERYWSRYFIAGLICHQPGSAQCPDPPTTIRPRDPCPPCTSASATLKVPNFMMAMAVLAFLKVFKM